jgi:molybdopterin-synthase adenylyltransferase
LIKKLRPNLSVNEKNGKKKMTDSRHMLCDEILASVNVTSGPADGVVSVLNHKDAARLSDKFHLSLNDLYIVAMDHGVWPLCYVRNQSTFSLTDQRVLAQSTVAVIGAGGLGGHVISLFARMGLGSLIIVDPDAFDETNLNRQSFATIKTLGLPKVRAVKKQLASINPAVAVIPHELKLTGSNFNELLSGADIAVDCLDTIPDRLILQDAAQKLKLPLVHGALAGFEGQIMTIYPEDPGLKAIYAAPKPAEAAQPSPESILGVPATTPAMIGSFQTMEGVKILLKRGRVMRKKMVYLDLDNCALDEFSFENSQGHPAVDEKSNDK